MTDVGDTWVLGPDDELLQRRAAQYVVDHIGDDVDALEVLAMLFAPVQS